MGVARCECVGVATSWLVVGVGAGVGVGVCGLWCVVFVWWRVPRVETGLTFAKQQSCQQSTFLYSLCLLVYYGKNKTLNICQKRKQNVQKNSANSQRFCAFCVLLVLMVWWEEGCGVVRVGWGCDEVVGGGCWCWRVWFVVCGAVCGV
jgi:hypothetical protein